MSRHEDEEALAGELWRLVDHRPYRSLAGVLPAGSDVFDLARARFGMPTKRTEYLLLKWSRRGLFDYGVSPRTGWFTPLAASRLFTCETEKQLRGML